MGSVIKGREPTLIFAKEMVFCMMRRMRKCTSDFGKITNTMGKED